MLEGPSEDTTHIDPSMVTSLPLDLCRGGFSYPKRITLSYFQLNKYKFTVTIRRTKDRSVQEGVRVGCAFSQAAGGKQLPFTTPPSGWRKEGYQTDTLNSLKAGASNGECGAACSATTLGLHRGDGGCEGGVIGVAARQGGGGAAGVSHYYVTCQGSVSCRQTKGWETMSLIINLQTLKDKEGWLLLLTFKH